MRLDKFLCEMGCGTRSQVKEIVRKGRVLVNDCVVKSSDCKIDENKDVVVCDGKRLRYQEFAYYMLHKPAGCVSATKDDHDKTVLDFIREEDKRKDLFPVGRLDKDTEGLLLITNDGELSHRLLSPKKHVPKTYFVRTSKSVTKEMAEALEAGVDIGEEKKTLPATVKLLAETEIYLTITEGKFHQVKRMLQSVGNEVVYLKRISMGALVLDETLQKGEYRALCAEEIGKLC